MELPFKVMDADGHIAEDVSRIKEYMEPPYNDNLWVGVPDSQGSRRPRHQPGRYVVRRHHYGRKHGERRASRLSIPEGLA